MNCQLCKQYLKTYLESTWIYCEKCEKHSHIRYVAHSGSAVVIGFTMDGKDLDWLIFPSYSFLRKGGPEGSEDLLDLPFTVTFSPSNLIERTRTYLVFS